MSRHERIESAKPVVWISVRRYCELYDIHRATVYKYLSAGLLESWQVGRVLRVAHRPPQPVKAQRSIAEKRRSGV